MRTRTALQLRTVTPAFIGTADPTAAEWNGKSIRGELRWWVRAVAGGETAGDATSVRDLEREIFGGASDGRNGDREAGQPSALRVLPQFTRTKLADAKEGVPPYALTEDDLAELWNPRSEGVKRREDLKRRLRLPAGWTNPLGYLGYGPLAYSTATRGFVYKRGWLPPGTDLSLSFQWNREISPSTKDLFERALWCWINLGGIGARSRRGFGSLCGTHPLVAVADADFRKTLEVKIGASRKPVRNRPAWTHFSSDTHVYRSKVTYQKWSEALKAAGAWMIAFRRRYGRADDERGIGPRDYEWYKNRAAGVPDRAGFGLPLPFSRKIAAWGKSEGRRASPLLIHIAQFAPELYRVIFTHIPAQLIPDGETIHFKEFASAATGEQYTIVPRFLGDLEKKGLVEVVL